MTNRPHLPVRLAILTLLAWGCTPAAPVHPGGPTGGTTKPSAPSRSATGAYPQQIETICDRQEDCAVERNIELAKRYSATPEDIKAARADARQALIMGVVRRWCLMRLARITANQVRRIHQCLRHTACAPFFTCANFPAAEAQVPPLRRALRAR